MKEENRIDCRTPNANRDGVTRIPLWKYECIQRTILEALEGTDDGVILFKDLSKIVQKRLTSNELAKLGSPNWHVTTVKLNMEVTGEIERIPGATPQALRKTV